MRHISFYFCPDDYIFIIDSDSVFLFICLSKYCLNNKNPLIPSSVILRIHGCCFLHIDTNDKIVLTFESSLLSVNKIKIIDKYNDTNRVQIGNRTLKHIKVSWIENAQCILVSKFKISVTNLLRKMNNISWDIYSSVANNFILQTN